MIAPSHPIITTNLSTRSLIHALRALKNYITQRLISEDNRERTESAIVTLIWMAASDSESTDTVATLSEDLDAISQSWVQALGADAAHAVALVRLLEPRSTVLTHRCRLYGSQLNACMKRKTQPLQCGVRLASIP